MEEKVEKELLLRQLYYDDPKTGYRSPQHLWELAKEENPNLDISKHFVKQWLLGQSAYTRFKKWNKPKHYRHTLVRGFCICRFAFAVPLKSKNGSDVKVGIEKVLDLKKDLVDIQNLSSLTKGVSF